MREAIHGDATLEPILEPMLRTLAATMEQLQVYDRATIKHARSDDTARLLMTAPGVGTIVAMGYITGIETPARFSYSSSVGAYFGMTPKRYQSGEVDKAVQTMEQQVSHSGIDAVQGDERRTGTGDEKSRRDSRNARIRS